MEDLTAVRAKISDIITDYEQVPIMAERAISFVSSKKTIEQMIGSCDGYIGIFHEKWGYVPREDNPDNLSVTAIEFEKARKIMPTFILVSAAKKEPQLENYLRKITDYNLGIWLKKYENPQQLYEFVYKGIPLLVNEITRKLNSDENIVELKNFETVERGNYDLVNPIPKETQSIINKIQLNSDAKFTEIQWKRLENSSTNQRLWKIDDIWKLIDQTIDSHDTSNLSRCLVIVRKMLINNKLENSNEVIDLLKYYNLSSKVESMFLGDVINVDLKRIIKDIFAIVYDEKSRFDLYWNYWKSISDIDSESDFYIQYSVIVSDFKNLSDKFRNEIEDELADLCISGDPKISSRATYLYEYLFS
jgi:hypothetical protein